VNLKKIFLNWLFPIQCCNCQLLGKYVCVNCFWELEFLTNPHLERSPTTHLTSLQAAAHFQEPLNKVIHQLKYGHVIGTAEWCGQLLYHSVQIPDVNLITWVPADPQRLKSRGYNQTQVIAQHLAKLLNLPYAPLLLKTKKTTAQAQLTKTDRRTNLATAFALTSNTQTVPITTKILIIDDVVTTGSTLEACAAVLQRAGFLYLHGLAVAHGS
jgi:competence protein ComFC